MATRPSEESPNARRVFYFGPFALDLSQRRLFRQGVPVRVTGKALDLLCALVSNPGVTLSIDEIMSTVWDDKKDLTDATLRQHVLMLRHALEENGSEQYIATDYARGYRFSADVTERPSPLINSIVNEYCAAAVEFRNSASPAALIGSLNLYDRALAVDPSSTIALAGAALTRVIVADFQYDRPKSQLELAKVQAEAALAADPNCVDALMASCKVQLDYCRDFAGALAIARRAIELDAKHRIAAFMNAWILALSGRFEQSLAFLDSLAPSVSNLNIIQSCRGITTLFSGDYSTAATQLEITCKQWPDYWFGLTFLGLALLCLGETDRALEHFDRVRLSAYDPLVDRQMNARYFAEGYALYTRFRIGDTKAAQSTLERLARLAESQFVPATCFALAEIGRKNRKGALRYIERCGDNRECWYTHLRVDPLVKELALDPARLYGRPELRS